MDTSLKAAYDAHQKELAISYSVLETANYEGKGLIPSRLDQRINQFF